MVVIAIEAVGALGLYTKGMVSRGSTGSFEAVCRRRKVVKRRRRMIVGVGHDGTRWSVPEPHALARSTYHSD